MHQSGIEVRPIRQMNDHSSFNEVIVGETMLGLPKEPAPDRGRSFRDVGS